MRALVRSLAVLLAVSVLAGARAEAADAGAGIRIRVDLEAIELRGSDPRRPDDPLRVPVVTGSPAHPTPTGRFTPRIAIRNPAWKPGRIARDRGAERMPPSTRTPMGIAKIPLGPEGFNLHGGADPLLLGKPASLGCLRLADDDMRALLDWLARGGALGPQLETPEGEVRQRIRRPVAFEVR